MATVEIGGESFHRGSFTALHKGEGDSWWFTAKATGLRLRFAEEVEFDAAYWIVEWLAIGGDIDAAKAYVKIVP